MCLDLGRAISIVMEHFCVLPFFAKEIKWNGDSTPCCLLPMDAHVDIVQQHMLAGRRAPECHRCWRLEDQGLVSERQRKNAELDHYLNRDLEFIREDAENGDRRVRMLKLFTSSTCNSTCSTCNFDYSSAWARLEKRINPQFEIKSRTAVDIDAVFQQVDFSQLRTLMLIGGEPLYEKKNFLVLQRLLDLGNSDCFVSIITNGSVGLTAQQKNLLQQFPNLNFCVSIDGVGPVFEYLRYPCSWTQMQENLDFFRSCAPWVSASYTVSNLNILYHQQTLDWFAQQDLPYAVNPVHDPAWFRPGSLPANIKQQLAQRMSAEDYRALIGDHGPDDDANYQRMLSVIRSQDRARGTDIKQSLPELCALLKL